MQWLRQVDKNKNQTLKGLCSLIESDLSLFLENGMYDVQSRNHVNSCDRSALKTTMKEIARIKHFSRKKNEKDLPQFFYQIKF